MLETFGSGRDVLWIRVGGSSIDGRRLTVCSTNELIFHVSFFSFASSLSSYEREIASKNVSSVASAV